MTPSAYIDEPLAICHLIGGANGLPWDKELSDDQIRAHVAKCIRVWNEIQRQLAIKWQMENSRAEIKAETEKWLKERQGH
jgi:hypothetical protein